MYKNIQIIHERSPININNINNDNKNNYKQTVTETRKFSPKGEYSLKQNFFDPTKNSPPNEFMLKLYMREQMYNFIQRNDDKLEIQ